MLQSRTVALVCDGCGATKHVDVTIARERGSRTFTCRVCEDDLHPRHELQSDEAPVVEV